jgi:hypothetical protein
MFLPAANCKAGATYLKRNVVRFFMKDKSKVICIGKWPVYSKACTIKIGLPNVCSRASFTFMVTHKQANEPY